MTDSTHLSAETVADISTDEVTGAADAASSEAPAAGLTAGRVQLAQAVVDVPLPQPGQTVVIQAAPGQTLHFLFDPATASSSQENGDLVLQINGGEVVIENWEAATSGETPVEITNADGTVINMADFLVAIGLPPGGETEPAAGGQPAGELPGTTAANQGAGFSPVQGPSILGPLDPEGPVDPTALSYRVPERQPSIFDLEEEDEPGPNAEDDGPGTNNEAVCIEEKALIDGGEGGYSTTVSDNVLDNDSFGPDGPGGIVGIKYLGGDSADPLTVTDDGGFPVITFTANDGSNDIWTLEFNLETGDYTFTLLSPYQHSGAGEDKAYERFSYTIEDADGDKDTATLTICIEDDVPSIEFGGGEGGLTVDESIGYGPAFHILIDDNAGDEQNSPDDPDDIGYAKESLYSFLGLYYDFGADGPGTYPQFTLTLSSNGVDSGLVDTESGKSIFLFNESGVIVGRAGGAGGEIVFTIEIDGEDLEIHQYRAIKHDDAPDDHDENDDPESIKPGVLKLTATITDDDGDTASDSIDLGQFIKFEDDGPTACITGGEGAIVLDETENDGDDTAGDGVLAKVTVAGGLLFNNHSDFGSDGEKAGGGNSFALTLAAPGVDSGLVDTATGNHVFMFLVNGQVVGKEGTDAADAEANGKVVFTISVDAATGDVTVTQSRAVKHDDPTDPDEEWSPESIDYGTVGLELTVTDGDGDTDSASIDLGSRILFEDDGPKVEVVGGEGVAVLDESVGVDPADPNAHDETAAGAVPGAIGYATLAAGAFFSVDAGSDGEKSRAFTLTLSAEGADSGLVDTETGNSVFLFLIGGRIVGREGTDATDALNNGDDVFEIEIDAATGEVEINQFRAVKHDDANDADESGPGEPESIAAGLIGVKLTVTDGDDDTASASIDLGPKILFEDDGPADIVVGGEGELRLDESLGDDELDSPDADDIGFDSIPLSSFFAAAIDYGSDGEGTTATYALTLPANGVPSGLYETASGHQIFLFDNGGVIEGRAGADAAAAETGTVVFTVSIVGDKIEVHQYEAIRHDDFPDDHDEADDPESIAAGALILEVTATDGDGDPVTGSIDLGQLIKFEDDGPTASLAAKTEPVALVLDETLGDKAGDINSDDEKGTGIPNDIGYATALASDLFNVTINFGSDGEKAGGGKSWELVLNGVDGVDSGLKDTQSQSAIVLVDNNGVIEGRVGDASGELAFTISIDQATGQIEVHQYRAVFHPDASNDHDQAGSPESITADLVKVKLTVTDGDGDQVSTDLAELGSLIKFEDDGPTVELTLKEGAEIRVDETANDGDENGSGLLARVTVAGSTLFNGTVDAGSDGEFDRGYVLILTASDGADSGLDDTLSGEDVLLYEEGGQIVGRTAVGKEEVFRISIDQDTGNVTVTQSRAVVHGDPTDPDEADTPKSIAPGLVEVALVVVDGDGDMNGANVDIGSIIKFEDDGPTFDADEADLGTVNEADPLPDVATGSIGVDFGSDGAGDVLSIEGPAGLTSGGEPITYSFDPVTNTLTGSAGGNTVFTVSIGSDGQYTFRLHEPIDHAEDEDSKALKFDFKVTDGDGDPVDGSFTVNVIDDKPAPEDDEATVGDAGNTVTNLIIVFDRSGSMDEDPNVDGFSTRLDLARAAIASLMDAYSSFAEVNIKIVDFAGNANHSQWFTGPDAAVQANAYLAGLTAAGETDYEAAINETMVFYDAASDPAPAADKSVVYFLSDGNPTEGGNAATHHLNPAQTAAWEDFLQAHGIEAAFAVGIGGGVNANALDEIAYPDGAENPVVLDSGNEEAIFDTLLLTVTGQASGNVLTDGTPDDFGADGQGSPKIVSIEIDGDVYEYDGTNIIRVGQGVFAAATSVLVLTTALGGAFTFDFATGAYAYEAAEGVNDTEDFVYTIKDGDGDVSSAHLRINVVGTSVLKPNLVFGTDDNDTGADALIGDNNDALADIISGGDGNDDLRANGSDDLLIGGAGADALFGGAGRDVLIGGTQGELSTGVIRAADGADYLDGGDGADFLFGNEGDDILVVGTGDEATGGQGSDIFILTDNTGFGVIRGSSTGEFSIATQKGNTLVFNGTLDLTTTANNKISGIETISMKDADDTITHPVAGTITHFASDGDDTLILDVNDVISLGGGVFDPGNALSALTEQEAIRVDGDDGDSLILKGSWSQVTDATALSNVPAGYNLWVHDGNAVADGIQENAYVLVQETITVQTS